MKTGQCSKITILSVLEASLEAGVFPAPACGPLLRRGSRLLHFEVGIVITVEGAIPEPDYKRILMV
jgi:hypothetical protein